MIQQKELKCQPNCLILKDRFVQNMLKNQVNGMLLLVWVKR